MTIRNPLEQPVHLSSLSGADSGRYVAGLAWATRGGRFSKYNGVTWNEQGDEVTVRSEIDRRPQTLVLRLR